MTLKFSTALLFAFICCLSFDASAQVNNRKYKVLFLGNSYTYVNNLPAITASAALSAGDTLVHDNNTIGGYTLNQHSTNTTSVSKIAAGGWDYVVLQEQSQLPSFSDAEVATDVFPYARYLDSLVHKYNSCGRSIFYMTWGRKNGDASNCAVWPPVCTYLGMDNLLRLRYTMMADSNNAVMSPVGAVWRYIRANYPSIELYQTDESHPSEAGSYAAACCFYTAIFKKSPELITYNFTLSATDAANIRTAVKKVVYDSMDKWHIRDYSPRAQSTYATAGNVATFTNTSANATIYSWNFGDGATSTLAAPVHNYSSGGTYTVALAAIACGKSDTQKFVISLAVSGIGQAQAGDVHFRISPNPVQNMLSVQSLLMPAQAYDVCITNGMGQVVYRASNSFDMPYNIDVSGMSSGIYFISVSDNGKRLFVGRFVKD